jgi:hypothetical protein
MKTLTGCALAGSLLMSAGTSVARDARSTMTVAV